MNMVRSRNLNINLNDFLKEKKLEDLTIEGEFNPNEVEPLEQTDLVSHFKIKGHKNWGVTYPKIPFVDAKKANIPVGYFHEHGDERVYLSPPLNMGLVGESYGKCLVPCLECGVAIEWKL